MRKRFEQQLNINILPIPEVPITTKSRDEFPPLMRALQFVFTHPEYNPKIFKVLEDKILHGKKKTGRKGMDLWEILVLAATRLCLNLNYDSLHTQANFNKLLRQVMGVEPITGIEGKEYSYQNIIDNVGLLDEGTLHQINDIIVEAGHSLVKKSAGLKVKVDTYVLESNVHFPTDLNLLWDAGRKCCDHVGQLIEMGAIENQGWRKLKDWKRELKNMMRSTSKASARGGRNKEENLQKQAVAYIEKASRLSDKIEESLLKACLPSISALGVMLSLEYFLKMLDKHINLVDRRLLKKEVIPSQEKIYSLFETYTEWINKGKQHPNVELGKRVLVSTDQWDFIIDYKVADQTADAGLTLPLVDRLLSKYGIIESLSVDRGFYRKADKELIGLFVGQVIMPKKGKKNQIEQQEEKQENFRKIRKKHSAIESNINELEHNGLDRCPDRGRRNFDRYVGLGVAAYNLKKIGIILQKQEHKKLEKEKLARERQRLKQAA
jgi:hypothetical protein